MDVWPEVPSGAPDDGTGEFGAGCSDGTRRSGIAAGAGLRGGVAEAEA
jgi:hypothetical protein